MLNIRLKFIFISVIYKEEQDVSKEYPSLNKPETSMDRNYLLKIIEKNFIIFDKDEISKKITDNYWFDELLRKLVQEQSNKLDEEELRGSLHIVFCKATENILKRIRHDCNYSFEWEKIADTSLLIISIYYHYSAICEPVLMYNFIRKIMKEKILLV